MNKHLIFIFLLAVFATACSEQSADTDHPAAEQASGTAHDEDRHGDEDQHGHGQQEGHEEEGGVVRLSPAQLETAGIVVTPLQPKPVAAVVTAPGEVKLNAYRTA